MLAWTTALSSMNAAPNTRRAMSMESCARSGEVTLPMKGLADQRRWA